MCHVYILSKAGQGLIMCCRAVLFHAAGTVVSGLLKTFNLLLPTSSSTALQVGAWLLWPCRWCSSADGPWRVSGGTHLHSMHFDKAHCGAWRT